MNSQQPPKNQGLTWKSALLGSLLIPINTVWVLRLEILSGGQTRGGGTATGGAVYPTTMSLFFNVVVLLLLLWLISRLLRRWHPRLALTDAELLTLYTMLSLATAVSGTDMLQVLVPMLGHPFWFATAENDWTNLFIPYLPSWFGVRDKGVLKGFYEGEEHFFATRHFTAFLIPLLTWTGFVAALLFVMGGLTVLLRRQWVEHEKLSYPIVQVPLAIIDGEKTQLFKSHLFWGGFLITGIFTFYNGWAYLFPRLPLILLQGDVGRLFTESPWNAIGFTPFRLYPFVVGLAYLIPLDLSFSCWFFYWFTKGERIVGRIGGWRGLPLFPYSRQQSFGAYVGICLFALWMGRRHLGQVLQRIGGEKPSAGESNEPLPYRTALFFILIGFAFLTFLCRQGGMSFWAIFSFFGLYFLLSLGVTRMRAELGAPGHDLHYIGPESMLVTFLGTRAVGIRNLTWFSCFYFFNRAYRCHPMPHQLEGFKIAHHHSIQGKGMFIAIIFGGLLGTISTLCILLHEFYRLGALRGVAWYGVNAFGREPFARLESWLSFPSAPDISATAFTGVGFGVTLLLLWMRSRFIWWSLHPLGYALADDYTMNWIWSSLFLSWLIKWFILRLGGVRRYRNAIPFFIGLILGEFVVGSGWSVVSILSGQPMYAFKNW
jgi:hypothetical protein